MERGRANAGMLGDSVSPTHDYEPLTGGTGKDIHYRQPRHAIADLLGTHSDIDHYVGFASLTGAILDFGISGLAFSLPAEAPAAGSVIDGFRVVIGNDTLYQGRALIRYCRRDTHLRTKVGAQLLDGTLDRDAMVMAKNRALVARTASSFSETLDAGPSQPYREAMADLVLLLSSYRELLDSQEQSLRSLSAPGVRDRAEEEILDIAIAQFSAQYERYRRRCNELTSGLSGPTKAAYRRYTEAVLHPHMISAPDIHHAYHKPLGYPGDYVLMSYLYDPRRYGNSLYDKLIHQVAVREEPMAEGVRKRKDFLLEQIRLVVASKQHSTELPCRILSLACGPAQEIVEFVAESPGAACPVVFTLIDQDQRALNHANSRLSRLLIPGATSIRAEYLYVGARQLIAQLDAFEALPAQDLIYAAGLFDYIKTPTAQRLVRRLFQKLRRGGKLVVGNFKAPNDATWGLEYVVDWRLIYRTRDDMRAIAETIDESCNVQLTSDASGYTYMLMIARC